MNLLKMSLNNRLTLLFLVLNMISIAQPNKIITNKDNYNWMFGASWMMLDDDGAETNPFNFSQYHSAPYPSRFFVDKYLYNGWSVEGSICFQSYDSTKYVNDSLRINGSLFGFDVHSKYSFYKLLGRSWVDPYVLVGGGVTNRQLEDRNTAKAMSISANIGGGINFWVSNNIGIQLQSVAKFSLNDFMGPSNYMAHTAGVVIRLEKSNGEGNDFAKSKYKVKKSRSKIKMPKSNKNGKES
jgi:hypothetical protein